MNDRLKFVGNFVIGVTGTVASRVAALSLDDWAQIAGIFAGLFTGIWMIVQIVLAVRRKNPPRD